MEILQLVHRQGYGHLGLHGTHQRRKHYSDNLTLEDVLVM